MQQPKPSDNKIISPWWVIGFADGEASFSFSVAKSPKTKKGWRVVLDFEIGLHIRDREILQKFKIYLGVGRIYKSGAQSVLLRVQSIKEIAIIIKHFKKYPLVTQKHGDYEIFQEVFYLIQNKEHLIVEGLNKIVSLKANHNWGFSSKLKVAFAHLHPVARPIVKDPGEKIQNPHWLAGFTTAEGCFSIDFAKSPMHSTGFKFQLNFSVVQHARDEQLMRSLLPYLNCKKIYQKKDVLYYRVTKPGDTLALIIPFFHQFPIEEVKSKYFEDFGRVVEMMKNKQHLTSQGLEEIKKIKSGMNRGRIGGQATDEGVNKPTLSLNKKTRLSTKVTRRSVSYKRHYSITPILKKEHLKADQIIFNQWLGGLIDGDGNFQCTKKGFSCLKIIMDVKDKKAFYKIKNKYGGSIKRMANSNSLKYKLKDSKNLIKLINDINGNIRNPFRMLQLYKICEKFNLELKEPKPLTYDNAWLSGFIDSDGSIYIDEKSGQLIISITQKNKYLLEPLQILYGGRIKILNSKDAFQYSIYRKEEILNLVDNYFNKYPLESKKADKINLIENFYQLEINYKTLENNYKRLEKKLTFDKLQKLKDWIVFKNKWDKL